MTARDEKFLNTRRMSVKKFLIAAAAAAAVAVLAWPSQASAYWAYRTVSRYDPHCGHVVLATERYWVPDCVHAQPYPYGSGYGYGGPGVGYGYDRPGYGYGPSNPGQGGYGYRSDFGPYLNRSPWR